MQEPGSGITSASGWAGAATSTGGVCYMKKCYDRAGVHFMLVTTKGVMNHSMKLQTLLLIHSDGLLQRVPILGSQLDCNTYDKVREVCMIQVCYREGVLCMKIGED